MFFLVPVALYGWLFISLLIYNTKKDIRIALLMILIGGFLFLPVYSYDIPLIEYDKMTAISLSLLVSLTLSGKTKKYKIKRRGADWFIIIWCFISPVITSLVNGLGLYDGISTAVAHVLKWGVFYWIGRKFFTTERSLKKLLACILLGTLIYLPLCLIEIRLSPQLNRWIYGYHSHSFLQHIRRGGYRPMVFMQHGLKVSLWMAAGTIIAFMYVIEKKYKRVLNIPIELIFIGLLVTTVMTKSSGAAVLMILGLAVVFYYHISGKVWPVRLMILAIPVYIFLRMQSMITTDEIIDFISRYFSPERTSSLWFRLYQEDLYTTNMSGHMLFGWGGWNRSTPINPLTGELLIIRDALWLILYSEFGLYGLMSVYSFLLVGPWALTRKKTAHHLSKETFVLLLIVVIYCMDSLLNSMLNPVFLLCSGALVSQMPRRKKRKRLVLASKVNKKPPVSPVKKEEPAAEIEKES